MERKYTIRDVYDQSGRGVGEVQPDDYFEGQNATPTEGENSSQSFGTQAKAITSVALINTDTPGDIGFLRIFVGVADPGIDYSLQVGDIWIEANANRGG
jgi:hypothetical protein